MKKLIFILILFISFEGFSQSLYVPNNPDSIKVPVNVNGAIRTVYVVDLVKNAKFDTTALHQQLIDHLAAIQANASAITLKQNQLNGTGFVKANGTSISYDNTNYISDTIGLHSQIVAVNNALGTKLNTVDTLNKWLPKTTVIPAAIDTTPLHTQIVANTNAIGTKLNISDTTNKWVPKGTVFPTTDTSFLRRDINANTAAITVNTGNIASNTTAIAGKEPNITAGTTSQYWRGDKTWQTFPTIPAPLNATAGTNMTITGTYPNLTFNSTGGSYTDVQARAAISLTTTGTSGAATYNSSTGVLNIPSYAGGGASGWNLTGNTITPSNFLGTTSNNSLRIRTNNIERVIFDSVGNIKMGVDSFKSTTTPLQFSMGGTYGSSTSGNLNNLKFLVYKDQTSSYGIGMSAGKMEIQANGGSIGFFSSGTEAMRLSNLGVGIGATTPSYPIDFGSTLANTKIALYNGPGSLYGMGVQGSQFRLHLNSSSDKFSFLVSAAGSELFAIKGTGGVVLTPMTKAQRDALASPEQGRMVFVSDNGGYLSYYNAGWFKVSAVAD